MNPINLVVLVSGAGSNLKAIAQAIDDQRCLARIVAVLSDQSNAGAIDFAKSRGIPSRVVPYKKGDDRQKWNLDLANAVESYHPDLVVLAGFMRLIGAPLLQAFPSKIINVHPSLLPAFPGAHAPADALAAGVTRTGCTVHIVDSGLDSGPILTQAEVPILSNDTVETLHKRIKIQEHRVLPLVIDAIAKGTLSLNAPIQIHFPSPGASQ